MFGPKNKQEEFVFAEESLKVDILCELQKAIHASGISIKELVNRLNYPGVPLKWTAEEVDCILKDPNSDSILDLTTISDLFHALGHECSFKVTPVQNTVCGALVSGTYPGRKWNAKNAK